MQQLFLPNSFLKIRNVSHTLLTVIVLLIGANCVWATDLKGKVIKEVKETEIARAKAFLLAEPITVTDASCERSAGGVHDFYSEGDYWWPNPDNPQGPYMRKDGQSNPGNFSNHRHAMVRLSEIVATLTSAYLLTNEQIYANKALEHLNAWFVNEATLMNPNMLYAQAIWGRHTGRGIGLIDAYHFVEVTQSIKVLIEKGAIPKENAAKLKSWFAEFLHWMTTHKYGVDEMNTENNHATCWVATAASMAVLTENTKLIAMCRTRFKEILLPNQMDEIGSFPRELGRTKPYGYSLFNIDAFCNVAEILSTSEENLWEFETSDGRSLKTGLAFIYPFIVDKSAWKYEKDIFIWEEWPVCHPALLFGGIAYENEEYIKTYLELPLYPTQAEVIRNLPVRHPVIWLLD